MTQAPPSKQTFLEQLRQSPLSLPPLSLSLKPVCEVRERAAKAVDGVLDVVWREGRWAFAFVYQASSTPKSLELAMMQAKAYSQNLNDPPLVILPFLPEKSLLALDAEGLSGVDLCGNGVLRAPGLSVWQSGHENRFKEPAPLRNVFKGNSSILARCFLLRPEFASMMELQAFALKRVMQIEDSPLLSKGTVSKVVKCLEEEKIIVRSQQGLRLAAAPLLLEQLRANDQKSRGRRIEGKTALPSEEIWRRLGESGLRHGATGDASAGRYHVLSGVDKTSLYVSDVDAASRLLDVTPGRAFSNIELREADSDLFYFDLRFEGGIRWASPIQTWLELSHAGPREREAARHLEAFLLSGKAEALP